MVKCPSCNWETETLFKQSNMPKKAWGMCANCVCSEMVMEGYLEVVE